MLVFGYAHDAGMETPIGHVGGSASEWTQATHAPPAGVTLDNYDPGIHFLAEFDMSRYNFHPAGMSGCGIWWHQRNERELWSPNLALGGVCTHYYERVRLLKFLRAEVVVEFLDSSVASI